MTSEKLNELDMAVVRARASRKYALNEYSKAAGNADSRQLNLENWGQSADEIKNDHELSELRAFEAEKKAEYEAESMAVKSAEKAFDEAEAAE